MSGEISSKPGFLESLKKAGKMIGETAKTVANSQELKDVVEATKTESQKIIESGKKAVVDFSNKEEVKTAQNKAKEQIDQAKEAARVQALNTAKKVQDILSPKENNSPKE